jgi:hypothetical protein
MAWLQGDRVEDPRVGSGTPRRGLVVAVERNPACLRRTLTVLWDDGEMEELDEEVLGPLDD